MHHALVGSQPAQLGMVGDLAEDAAEPRHQLVDLPAHQDLAQRLDGRQTISVPGPKVKASPMPVRLRSVSRIATA